MKRVLLTGCGGSIGVHTIAHIFHNTDWHIVGTDSFAHKGWSDRVVQGLNDHPEWYKRLTMLTHDLTAPFSEHMIKKMGKIDYIISMAALSDVEASITNPAEFIQNNTAIAVNMLELAREIKPEMFIQISTDEVYGASEEKDAGHPEWDAIIPSNPYSASKACQEAIAISYWRAYGVPVVITNTMNNFGEMQQGSKYPAMLQKWIENDETVIVHGEEGDIGSRFYLHSRNHADALLYIMRELPAHMHEAGTADRPDRYNIAGDIRLDNLELAETVARLMGKELKSKIIEDFHSTRPGHDKHYGLDGTKLKEAGWNPPLEFEESLKNTIEWQRRHPDWL